MDHRVRAVIDAMEQAMGDVVELDRLAATAGVSKSGLRALFQRQLGQSPSQCLKRLRMERARYLLLSSPLLSVKEVMARVGLCDQSHFVRDFERQFGLSPARYRDQHLDNSSTGVLANKQAFRPTNHT